MIAVAHRLSVVGLRSPRLARSVQPVQGDCTVCEGSSHVLGWRNHRTDPADPADPVAHEQPVGTVEPFEYPRRPLPYREGPSLGAEIDEGPSEEGPSMLPDSLTARASFTHGFPHYPYPNLPMTLRSVVNRCANSEHMIGPMPPGVNGLGLRILHISERKSVHSQAIRARIRTAPVGQRARPHQ
jgi:hypothetical protein